MKCVEQKNTLFIANAAVYYLMHHSLDYSVEDTGAIQTALHSSKSETNKWLKTNNSRLHEWPRNSFGASDKLRD